MKIILAIGSGGFIGAVLRYLLSQIIQTKQTSAFPLGTLVVNILGCFLIGIVFGLADKGSITQNWKLFLATGFLGGFTTFSAFSYETVSLLRDGQFGYAMTYVISSVVVGLLATFAGIAICRIIES
jgi:fluoride exporter